jgi:hypothetical protein
MEVEHPLQAAYDDAFEGEAKSADASIEQYMKLVLAGNSRKRRISRNLSF